MLSIEGTLTRIRSHKPSRWHASGVPYLIAHTREGDVVKGKMLFPVVGETYKFWGEYQPGRDGSPEFNFFHFSHLLDDTPDGIELYLSRARIKGVSRGRAALITEHFGEQTLDVLRTDPARVAEVGGLPAAVAEAVVDHFRRPAYDPEAFCRLYELFKGYKPPSRVLESLLESYGSSAAERVTASPYMLLAYPRLGWQTVDRVATERCGYDEDGIERHRAAIAEAVESICLQGHTYAGWPEIEKEAHGLIRRRTLQEAWDGLVEDGELWVGEVAGTRVYAPPRLAAAEESIARRLALISDSARPIPPIDTEGLNAGQRAAVAMIEQYGVSIVAGLPGTGKTYVATRAIRCLAGSGLSVCYVAPTNRAARRGAELLAEIGVTEDVVSCTTIHRALEPVPSEEPDGVPSAHSKSGRGRERFVFSRREDYPLDADVIVADETSMDDVLLFDALVRAIAPSARLVLVGDRNQLQSVRAGAVLRDLMAAGIATVELTEIVRSESAGRVVRACHAVIAGRVPEPAEVFNLPVDNWIHIEAEEPDEIADIMVDLVAPTPSFPDPIRDTQVISPRRDTVVLSCAALNRRLSLKLNPPSGDDDDPVPTLRAGDKVVRRGRSCEICHLMVPMIGREAELFRHDLMWNDVAYRFGKTPVVNGDVGIVEAIIPGRHDSQVIVRFRSPDRLVCLPWSDHHLELAYAQTVHTCQGSGYPLVICPIHDSFHYNPQTNNGLLTLELFYTMISRTEKALVTVGQSRMLREILRRRSIGFRRTRLAGLVRAAFQGR